MTVAAAVSPFFPPGSLPVTDGGACDMDGDAAIAAALFAVDPAGLGGVALRSPAGPARDAWLARLQALLPAGSPLRRVPLHIGDERLLGGLDLAATLAAGRPMALRGLLAEADGGVLLVAMAERLSAATAARLAAVIDTGNVAVEREGFGAVLRSRFGVVALDEGGEGERLPDALADRLALHVELSGRVGPIAATARALAQVTRARGALAAVRSGADTVEALCAASLALGIGSARAPWLALRAARAAAALAGREVVAAEDAALAARLVLGPRATCVPAAEPEGDPDAPAPKATQPAEDGAPPPPASADEPPTAPTDAPVTAEPLDDIVLAAALAAIPAGLLATLLIGRHTVGAQGRVGPTQSGGRRGRPSGSRHGEPRGGARLNLIETLRAAAPWQTLRRREAAATGRVDAAPPARVLVRRQDFHVHRHRQHSATTTLFLVDASGSAALHRLAEAKGAVELLLADCYVRRDSVAVLAFRGRGADLLLPPTRSLVRAKRSLDGLPGGGGTPLAAGLDAALALCDGERRKGSVPLLVLLTDGRANIARDGTPGRARAAEDALAAARQWRAAGHSALLLDTSPQPQAAARDVAHALGARYLPLPHADAARMSQVVRAAVPAPQR